MPERDEALLRKVGDVIAAEPERYDQRVWADPAPCGTVACIGGHTELVAYGCSADGDGVEDLLGLKKVEADALFSINWRPAGDPSVPLHERVQAALYALADGASVEEVTASG